MVKFNSDIIFLDGSGQIRSTDGDLTLRADDTGLGHIIIGSGDSLRPEIDCDIDLGLNYLRWRNLYACSGQIGNLNGLDFNRLLPVDARYASGNIIPSVDVEWDLGSLDKRWSIGYISNIRATNIWGADGQTSPWNSSPVYPSADAEYNLGRLSTRWAHIYAVSGIFSNLNGIAFGSLLPVDSRQASGSIVPNSDSVYDLGSSSRRWNTAWSAATVTESIESIGSSINILSVLDTIDINANGNITLKTGNNLIIEDGTAIAGHLRAFPNNTHDVGGPTERWAHVYAASGIFDNLNGIPFGNLRPVDSRQVSGSIIPNTTNTYDLGSSSALWRNVYASSGVFSRIQPTTGDNLTVAASLLPDQDVTSSRNLGSSSFRWNDLYVSSAHMVSINGNDGVGDPINTNTSLWPVPTNTYQLGTSALRWSHIFAASGIFDLVGASNISVSDTLVASTGNFLTLSASDSLTVDGSVSSDLVPTTNAIYDVGLSSFRWATVYGVNGDFTKVAATSGIINNLSSSNTNERTTLNGSGIAVRNEIVRWDSSLGFSNSNGQTLVVMSKDGAGMRFGYGIGYPTAWKLDKNYSVWVRTNNALATPTWYLIVRKRSSGSGGFGDSVNTTEIASGLVHFPTTSFSARGHVGSWMYSSEANLELNPSESIEIILHNNGSGLAIDAPSCRLTWGVLENIPNSGVSL